MEINIIYSGHNGPPSIHYEGPEGIVKVSEKRHSTNFNVFTHMITNPKSNDCFVHTEPVVVRPGDFNENALSKYRKVFTWANIKGNNIVKCNYMSSLWSPSIDELKNNPNWSDRKNQIVIIANSKTSSHAASIYQLRIKLADYFHKNGFNVAWYGHTKINKPYYKGTISDKIDLLRGVKFTICSENTYGNPASVNYLTEKLPHAIYAGAVPIYKGCFNIDEYFDSSTFIDLRKYNENIKELHNRVLNFSEKDYNKLREESYKQRELKNGFFNKISHQSAYKIMLNVLSKESI